jgi:hypothetical protein
MENKIIIAIIKEIEEEIKKKKIIMKIILQMKL